MKLKWDRSLMTAVLLTNPASALPVGQPSNATTATIAATPDESRYDANSTDVLLYHTAYSACSSGVEQVMITFGSLNWCAHDNEAWCNETIGSYVADIASKAVDSSVTIDYAHCDDACLLAALADITRIAALWGMRWAEQTFNDTGMASNDAVTKLHWTEWKLNQETPAIDRTALHKAMQQRNLPIVSEQFLGDNRTDSSAVSIPAFSSTSKHLGRYVDPAHHHHNDDEHSDDDDDDDDDDKHLGALLGAVPAVLGGSSFLTFLLAKATLHPGTGPTFPQFTSHPGCGGCEPVPPTTQNPPEGWTAPDPPVEPATPPSPAEPVEPQPGPAPEPPAPGPQPGENPPNPPEPPSPGRPPVEDPPRPPPPPPPQDPPVPNPPSPPPPPPPQNPPVNQPPSPPPPPQPETPPQKPPVRKPPSPPPPSPPQPQPEKPRSKPWQHKPGDTFRGPNGANLEFAPRHKYVEFVEHPTRRQRRHAERIKTLVNRRYNPFDVLNKVGQKTGKVVWHRWSEVSKISADWNKETKGKSNDEGDEGHGGPQQGPSDQRPPQPTPPPTVPGNPFDFWPKPGEATKPFTMDPMPKITVVPDIGSPGKKIGHDDHHWDHMTKG